ncbi:hypothetical protein CDAR_618701 [Caerostris darwini]|uniref:Uncharacterized protein n=1 Tax=Caerostris darwini TaxID=1538125 RepID=A0AAV4WSN7_9ARAC|nr:hypothetical protein CDAR_618701 [Caerostris darwini]
MFERGRKIDHLTKRCAKGGQETNPVQPRKTRRGERIWEISPHQTEKGKENSVGNGVLCCPVTPSLEWKRSDVDMQLETETDRGTSPALPSDSPKARKRRHQKCSKGGEEIDHSTERCAKGGQETNPYNLGKREGVKEFRKFLLTKKRNGKGKFGRKWVKVAFFVAFRYKSTRPGNGDRHSSSSKEVSLNRLTLNTKAPSSMVPMYSPQFVLTTRASSNAADESLCTRAAFPLGNSLGLKRAT